VETVRQFKNKVTEYLTRSFTMLRANADIPCRHASMEEHRKSVLSLYDHFITEGLLGTWSSIEVLSVVRFLGVNFVAKWEFR